MQRSPTSLRPRWTSPVTWAVTAAAVLLTATGCGPLTRRPPPRPNILLIQADDLGYGDIGAYGQARFRTPSLDRLGREGIRFTNYYAGAPICAPSRATLMTGLHTGHTTIRGNRTPDLPLAADEVTIAQALRRAGYRTAAIGKWGLGGPATTGEPRRKGFDYSFGFLEHVHAHRKYTDHLYRNGKRVSVDPNAYADDLFTAEARSFIERAGRKPFFLYLNYTAPHAELLVPEDSLASQLGRFPETPYVGPVAHPRAESEDQPRFASQPNPRAAYAATVERLDRDIGRLVRTVDEHGLGEETLIVFVSDNGPNTQGGVDPFFFKSSGGLRGRKRGVYEGGLRVPMIVRWTGSTPPGRVSDHVWAHWDVFPTLAELAGAEVPKGIDGISMVPALRGQPAPTHDFLYWERHGGHHSSQAVRMGDWKLVRTGGSVELYDLETDPKERDNVAWAHRDVVTRIERYLDTARTPSETWPTAGQRATPSPAAHGDVG